MCAPIVLAVAIEDGQVTLDLGLPADLPCFLGHFPNFPVLAGVVQLDWAMRLGVAHLACGQPCATDFRVKFKRVIMPGNKLTLVLRQDFVYRNGDLVASEGRVTLAPP
jgi:3-hydroxymyristoyl/3-hydroxydecanoyl-(acyl carrier protein) dehydratase